jgi:hypothetical protein
MLASSFQRTLPTPSIFPLFSVSKAGAKVQLFFLPARLSANFFSKNFLHADCQRLITGALVGELGEFSELGDLGRRIKRIERILHSRLFPKNTSDL